MTTIALSGPYAERPICFLELIRHYDWTIKVYSITADRPVSAPLVEAAQRLAFDRLDAWRAADQPWEDHGSAFLIVHHGRDANYVLLDWWMAECILQHHVWISKLETPLDFEYVSPTGLCVCVWELEILQFEREAWIRHVLARSGGPNLEGYFNDRLNVRAGV
jgi:hypothetical protein